MPISEYIGTVARSSTMSDVFNAIAEAHKATGLESPTHSPIVRNTMKGIRRTLGTAPVQKAAALTDDIRATVESADAGLIGLRDRALILLGLRLSRGYIRPS